MSALEDRISALEDTVVRVRDAWHSVSEERDRLREENKMLQSRLSDIMRRMQDMDDKGDLQLNEEQHALGINTLPVSAVRKEIKQYIAEIDQCLESLNSI